MAKIKILSLRKINIWGRYTYRAPANRSTESVSDEECCRDRFGVRPENENFRVRRVSESDPDDEAGEHEA